ncbi:MAG: hypothetical protein AB7E45_00680 [Candidatus Caldatribacteriota bacterium]
MSKKVDQIEKEKRVYEISLMLRRKPNSYIVEYIRRNWGIKTAQAFNYIALAREEWKKYFEKVKGDGISYHISELREIKDKAWEKEDLRLAFDVAKEEMRIMGIYPIERHKVELEGKVSMSKEEMYELIQVAQRAINNRGLSEGD